MSEWMDGRMDECMKGWSNSNSNSNQSFERRNVGYEGSQRMGIQHW